MELLQALALGVVQALAEFLPISSSGHLILVPWLLGWNAPLLNSLAFDAALHLGTGLALLAFFWRDLWSYALAGLRGLLDREVRRTDEWRLAWLIVVGTVPGAVVGVVGEDAIERLFRSPVQVAVLLIVFGLLLFVLDRIGAKRRRLEALGWRDAIVVGVAQAVALMQDQTEDGDEAHTTCRSCTASVPFRRLPAMPSRAAPMRPW